VKLQAEVQWSGQAWLAGLGLPAESPNHRSGADPVQPTMLIVPQPVEGTSLLMQDDAAAQGSPRGQVEL
jgi:hypothetical protein